MAPIRQGKVVTVSLTKAATQSDGEGDDKNDDTGKNHYLTERTCAVFNETLVRVPIETVLRAVSHTRGLDQSMQLTIVL